MEGHSEKTLKTAFFDAQTIYSLIHEKIYIPLSFLIEDAYSYCFTELRNSLKLAYSFISL